MAQPHNPTDEEAFGALAPLATAVIAVFTTVAGGLATVGGATDRVIRNHPGWALTALISLSLALALAAGSTYGRGKPYITGNRKIRRLLLGSIAVFFVGGLVGSIGAA